jgi:proteasome accessory factor C
MSVSATARLSRLLAMVPWLLERQGVPLAEAAGHFEVSEEQVVKDLELLFVCGTPGHLPDDLIEAEWESGRVYLGNAEAIARPLRLAVDEAVALLAGLRTLADVPGLHDREPVESALAKLSAAAGDATSRAGAVSVDLTDTAAASTLAAARQALAGRRRLRLRYLVPSRDETTDRDVDPIRVVSVAGHWYLDAWCHRAEAVRRFRMDRVVSLEVLDVDGTPPARAAVADDDAGRLFVPGEDDAVVTLDLTPAARWVADYYPVDSSEPNPGGEPGLLRVRLRTSNPAWVPRLVLRTGGAARIVDPPELARQAADLARAALEGYAVEPAGVAVLGPQDDSVEDPVEAEGLC